MAKWTVSYLVALRKLLCFPPLLLFDENIEQSLDDPHQLGAESVKKKKVMQKSRFLSLPRRQSRQWTRAVSSSHAQ